MTIPDQAAQHLPQLDEHLQRVLQVKDRLLAALHQFQNTPTPESRVVAIDLSIELDKAYVWIEENVAWAPGKSWVLSMADTALDRARRELDQDVYMRDPAERVRLKLDEMLDAMETVENAVEALREHPEDSIKTKELETAVLVLSRTRTESVTLSKNSWRTAVVDFNVEHAEDSLSRARTLLRQVGALQNGRVRKTTREALEFMIKYG